MELRYPVIIIFVIIGMSCYFILAKKKSKKYTVGSKIANTEYLKNTEYFKIKIKKYMQMKKIVYLIFITCIISSTILISRLAKTNSHNSNQYNRDIFLCMDISSSVDELNIELVESLKKTVNKLRGERFGISIFNTSSVTLVPLTDDYDYVNSVLDKISKSIKVNNLIEGETDDDYLYYANYILSGTEEGSEIRGSSLIGDGLASCVYNFSNLDTDRTRIIILSTDNDLAGTPLVTLEEAASISKSKEIKVFGIGAKIMGDEDGAAFKNAIEKTNGKFYEHSNTTVNNIVNDIEATSKSLLETQVEITEIDIPQIPFILLIISISGLIISKKVIR